MFGGGFGADFLIRLPALLVAIVFHEYAHGRVAHELGDPTPAYQGRLTLNPLAHLDPIGLLMLWVFRFGWAKPVQINPSYFRDPRADMIKVSAAGPLANLLLAFFAILFLKIPLLSGVTVWRDLVNNILLYNVVLAVFNLIPIPPLDGSKVLGGLLPGRYAYAYNQLQSYGWIILILFIWSGAVGAVLWPGVRFVVRALDVLASPIARLLGGI